MAGICRHLRRLLYSRRRRADRLRMKTFPARHEFAWLFMRNEESVRLQIHEHGEAFKLVINGPGVATTSHEFETISSLMIFVTDYQEQLRGQNFQLQASAERRATPRSVRPDGGPDRRRQ